MFKDYSLLLRVHLLGFTHIRILYVIHCFCFRAVPFNLHTTVKNKSHFYLHRGPMDPKNYGIRYKRHARLKTILGCIISREVPTTYTKQVKRKCLTSYGIPETEIYPIEYMGFSHYFVMIVKFKVVTFLES